jgi:Cu/Ag efflux protein CusF
MKSIFRFFLVPLITLAFAGVGLAQQTPTSPSRPSMKTEKPEKKKGKHKVTRATGEVVSVDPKAGMLTVKTKDKELSLTAEKGAKSALEKIKAGDHVRVSYTEKDGKLIASSLSEMKTKTAATTKAETKGKAESKAKGTEKKAETKATEKKAEKKEEPKTEKK